MEKNNHHIDDLFRNELGNIEINPPESVWNNIKSHLDKKRKARILYYRIGMAAGFALFVGIGGLYINGLKSPEGNVVEVQKNINQQEAVAVINTEKTSTNAERPQINISSTPVNKGTLRITEIKSNISSPGEKEGSIISNDISQKNNSFENIENNIEPLAYLQPKSGILINKTNQQIDGLLIDNGSVQPEINSEPLLANNEIKNRKHRWSIEAQFAPQYSYRTLTGESVSLTNKSEFNQNEAGLLAYAGAFKINFDANRRLSIQSGVIFSIMGQTLENLYVINPGNNNTFKTAAVQNASWVNNSLGLIVDDSENTIYNISVADNNNQATYFNKIGITSVEETISRTPANSEPTVSSLDSKIIQQLKIIEIPILIRYKIIDKRMDWHILGGLSANILIGSDALFKDGTSTSKFGKTIGLEPYNYIGTAGFGISYSLSRRISLQFEPTFKYYLNYIAEKEGYRSHPYSYALFTGIKYQF